MADQKRQLNVPLDPELAEAVHRAAHRAYRSKASWVRDVLRRAIVDAGLCAAGAAELQHLAHERRLPFFVSGAGGFAIMSRDLGQWRAAVQQAGCCGE
jgi:hypothetical protein